MFNIRLVASIQISFVQCCCCFGWLLFLLPLPSPLEAGHSCRMMEFLISLTQPSTRLALCERHFYLILLLVKMLLSSHKCAHCYKPNEMRWEKVHNDKSNCNKSKITQKNTSDAANNPMDASHVGCDWYMCIGASLFGVLRLIAAHVFQVKQNR